MCLRGNKTQFYSLRQKILRFLRTGTLSHVSYDLPLSSSVQTKTLNLKKKGLYWTQTLDILRPEGILEKSALIFSFFRQGERNVRDCCHQHYVCVQDGTKIGLQLFIWKIIQQLINNNTKINCVLHTHNCKTNMYATLGILDVVLNTFHVLPC